MKNYLISAILLLPCFGYAKEQPVAKQLYAVVEVTVEDSVLLKDASVEFHMYRNDINTDLTMNKDIYVYKIAGPESSFKILLSVPVNYGRIVFNSASAKSVLNYHASLFIFQHGDRIKMYLSRNGLTFKGKGNERYNCLFTIYQQKESVSTQFELPVGPSVHQAALAVRKEIEDALYQRKCDILKSYKHQLNAEVYDLIDADCWAEYNARLIGSFLNMAGFDLEQEKNEAIRQAYSSLMLNLGAKKLDERLCVKSFKYADFLYMSTKFGIWFSEGTRTGRYNPNYTFSQLFGSIKKNYTGLLHDKLILLAFLSELRKRPDAETFFDDAIAAMDRGTFKNQLLKIQETATGTAFAFELADQTGKIHKLSDYQGKVVLLDFWFTGCMACKELARQMKPVLSHYQSNSRVAFITISIDGDKFKDLWLKSLNEETYSDRNQINLLAAQAKNSAIIRHYNITAYPSLILLSKTGKVISTSPPRPGRPGGTESLINLIGQYL